MIHVESDMNVSSTHDHAHAGNITHGVGIEEHLLEQFRWMNYAAGWAHLSGGIVSTLQVTGFLWAAIHRYFKSEMSKKEGWVPGYQYESSLPFTCRLFGHKPVFGWLKLLTGISLIIVNLVVRYDPAGAPVHIGILLGLTVYGLAEIIYYHGVFNNRDWDYCAYFLMVFTLALFVSVHYKPGKPGPEVVLEMEAHKYLRYSVYMILAGTLAEGLRRKSFFAALARMAAHLLTTTYLISLGLSYCYNDGLIVVSDTEEEKNKKIEILRDRFIYVFIAAEVHIMLLLAIGFFRVRAMGPDTPTYELMPKGWKPSAEKLKYSDQEYRTVKQHLMPDGV